MPFIFDITQHHGLLPQHPDDPSFVTGRREDVELTTVQKLGPVFDADGEIARYEMQAWSKVTIKGLTVFEAPGPATISGRTV